MREYGLNSRCLYVFGAQPATVPTGTSRVFPRPVRYTGPQSWHVSFKGTTGMISKFTPSLFSNFLRWRCFWKTCWEALRTVFETFWDSSKLAEKWQTNSFWIYCANLNSFGAGFDDQIQRNHQSAGWNLALNTLYFFMPTFVQHIRRTITRMVSLGKPRGHQQMKNICTGYLYKWLLSFLQKPLGPGLSSARRRENFQSWSSQRCDFWELWLGTPRYFNGVVTLLFSWLWELPLFRNQGSQRHDFWKLWLWGHSPKGEFLPKYLFQGRTLFYGVPSVMTFESRGSGDPSLGDSLQRRDFWKSWHSLRIGHAFKCRIAWAHLYFQK